MNCVIYKSSKKTDSYLYIEKADDFTRVPPSLIEMLGQLEMVMALELSHERKLANADADSVRKCLRDQGYYLQIPPRPELAFKDFH